MTPINRFPFDGCFEIYLRNTALILSLVAWLYFCKTWVGIDAVFFVIIFHITVIFLAYNNLSISNFLISFNQSNPWVIIGVKLTLILLLLSILTDLNSGLKILTLWTFIYSLFIILIKENKIYYTNIVLNIFIALIFFKFIYQLYIPQFPHIADAIDYILNGYAFIQNIKGISVSSEAFNLHGLRAENISTWFPDGSYSFAEAAGSKNFLYSLLIGLCLHLNISLYDFQFINLGFIAVGILAWGYLAWNIFGSQTAANVIMFLCAIDSGFMASILTLWRESIVIFILPILIIIMINTIKYRHYLIYLIFFGSLLGIVRHNLIYILILLMPAYFLIYSIIIKYPLKKTIILMIELSATLLLMLLIVMFLVNPSLNTFNNIITKIYEAPYASLVVFKAQQTSQAPNETDVNSSALVATKGYKESALSAQNRKDTPIVDKSQEVKKETVDSGIMNWSLAFKDRPVYRVLMDVTAATFFNPNPNWLRSSPNWIAAPFWTMPEQTLLYPEMLLVIAFTPCFIVGIFFSLVEKNIKARSIFIFLLILSSIIVVMAILLFGSYSGRQRVQLMPVFYIFVLQGILSILNEIRKRSKLHLL